VKNKYYISNKFGSLHTMKKKNKKLPSSPLSNVKSVSSKKKQVLKTNNAFHSANYRRRKKGLRELTFAEYTNQKIALDSSGRYHPRKENALIQSIEIFGKGILSQKKICKRCTKKKNLIEFSMRYSEKIILNVCKECEQERQKKYWKY
jgi:hypothetical protein